MDGLCLVMEFPRRGSATGRSFFLFFNQYISCLSPYSRKHERQVVRSLTNTVHNILSIFIWFIREIIKGIIFIKDKTTEWDSSCMKLF